MTGSELFTFLEFQGRLQSRIENLKSQAQKGVPNEVLAEIAILEPIAKDLDDILHALNPVVKV